MILQTGEGVINRYATSLMGGKRAIDALNAGRSPFAAPSVNFDFDRTMSSALAQAEMPNRFMGSSVATPSPVAQSFAGAGQTVVNMTVESGAVQVISSGNSQVDGDTILDTVKQGIQTNRRGFRTTLMQKVGKGH